MKRTLIIFFSSLAMLVTLATVPSVFASSGDPDDLKPVENEERGMIWEGVVEGRAKSTCVGSYQLSGVDLIACTHGPDPSPPGVNVLADRPLLLQPRVNVASPDIHCEGDGSSGPRVQAIYAVSSDQANNFAAFKNVVGAYAGNIEQAFVGSASHFGGVRHVRWVHNGDCELDVQLVVMPPSGDDTFSDTINAVRAAGHDRSDRKYMIWTDANRYCGIATMYLDDRAGQANVNNGSYAMYARVDAACWGQNPSVEAHELMHNLGGVQPDAPNATSAGHCTDDHDRMCYVDGPGVVVNNVCPSTHEPLFDCNGDDYFNLNPQTGSWLANHWNTAESKFLVKTAPSVLDTFTRSLTNARTEGVHEFRTRGGDVDLTFIGKQESGRTWTVAIKNGSGQVVDTSSAARRIDDTVTLPAGSYTAEVTGGKGRYFLNVDYAPGDYDPSERLLKTFTRKLTDTRTKTRHVVSTSGGAVGVAFVGLEVPGKTWQLLVTDSSGDVVANRTGTRRIDTTISLDPGTYTFTVRNGQGRYFMNVNFPAPA